MVRGHGAERRRSQADLALPARRGQVEQVDGGHHLERPLRIGRTGAAQVGLDLAPVGQAELEKGVLHDVSRKVHIAGDTGGTMKEGGFVPREYGRHPRFPPCRCRFRGHL